MLCLHTTSTHRWCLVRHAKACEVSQSALGIHLCNLKVAVPAGEGGNKNSRCVEEGPKREALHVVAAAGQASVLDAWP